MSREQAVSTFIAAGRPFTDVGEHKTRAPIIDQFEMLIVPDGGLSSVKRHFEHVTTRVIRPRRRRHDQPEQKEMEERQRETLRP